MLHIQTKIPSSKDVNDGMCKHSETIIVWNMKCKGLMGVKVQVLVLFIFDRTFSGAPRLLEAIHSTEAWGGFVPWWIHHWLSGDYGMHPRFYFGLRSQ